MKTTVHYPIVCLILFYFVMQNTCLLHAQTTQKAAQDTTKKSSQKLQPEEAKPKLELPDVLIYGTDRSVRKTGEKLARPFDDARLVTPIIKYQPLIDDLKLDNEKNHYHSHRKHTGSRTFVQLDAGRYQQFNIEAGQWRETDNYNYSVSGKYDRSNGQYHNSQYYQGLIKAQLGIRVSPNVVISSQGNFRMSDYGLYGANMADLHRQGNGGKAKFDAKWSMTAEQSTDFSVYFQQNSCNDEAGNDYTSKLKQRLFGLVSLYQTRYRSIPIFIRGLYEYQNLDQLSIDSVNTQNYLQVKSWTSFKIKNYFIIKPGLQFENLDVNDSLSKYLVSPEIEIIAMPIPKIGIRLKASREYSPVIYSDLCEKNPFLSHRTVFIPMKKELELKLGAEYNPTSRVSLSGEIIRQNWKDYGYWSLDSSIGLFQLNSINQVNLTTLNLQSRLILSSHINLDAGIQVNIDSFNDDSLANDTNIPYLESLRIPFNFEYKTANSIQALLSFQWIGSRYADLSNETKLSGFGLLSLYLEKQLMKHIAVFIEGINLLNQQYEFWQNFPGMGIYFEAGLKGSW